MADGSRTAGDWRANLTAALAALNLLALLVVIYLLIGLKEVTTDNAVLGGGIYDRVTRLVEHARNPLNRP